MAKLERELEDLKLKLRLYEEPPDFDLNEYSIQVNGVQRTRGNLLGVGGHVRYCINVKNPKIKTSLKVFRRFSDWVVLSQILQQELPFSFLPMRPPKKMGLLGGQLDAAFVDLRVHELHAYTQCLVRHPSVRNNQSFRKFLYLPSEQWDELIGNVAGQVNAVDITDQNQELKQNLWKGLEKTGMSLLGSFGLFAGGQTRSVVKSKNKHVLVDADATRFCNVYERLMYVHVEEESDSNNLVRGDRSVVLEGATKSLLELVDSMEGKNHESELVAVALERLSMDEGTQLGPVLFNMLNAFSAALHESYQADTVLLVDIKNKSVSDHELLQSLQQQTFISQGGPTFYENIFKDEKSLPSNKVFESTLIPELDRVETDRTETLAYSLEPYVQAQIQNAQSKTEAYRKLLETLTDL